MTDSMWAYVANQNSKIQNILLSDNESGNSNKAPRLMSMDEYPHWMGRFETHLNGIDTNLWIRIETEYIRPTLPNNPSVLLAVVELNDEQRKIYDLEKKAYAILSQAIPRDILHQFKRYKTSHGLWKALKDRNEGNEKLKRMKSLALKKEFESFIHIGNESLGEIVTRYYHLLSEMEHYDIAPSVMESVETLADALPNKWSSFVLILKQSDSFADMDLNVLIQKLQEFEGQERRRQLRIGVPQDPTLYYSTTPPTNLNANANESAKLQTAYVSNTSGGQESTGFNSEAFNTCGFNASKDSPKSDSSKSQSSSSNTTKATLKTDNFDKITIEIAQEHFSTLACLVTSFNDLIAGQIGNCNLTFEDYEQIDKDEMDRMDIQWAFASAMRRSREYVKRTGQDINGNKDTKYGFSIEKARCYNCDELGHFARECKKPKRISNRNPFTRRDEKKDTKPTGNKSDPPKALVSNADDEGFDWGVKYSDVKKAYVVISEDIDTSSDDESVHDEINSAFMANTSDKGKNVEVVCEKCKVSDETITRLKTHNQSLADDLSKCSEMHTILKNNEKGFQTKIQNLTKEISQLKITVVVNQKTMNEHLDTIRELKCQLTKATSDYENMRNKLENYTNSSYVLDHILGSQRAYGNKQGLGYNTCPPPMSNDYSFTTSNESASSFKVKTPLCADPFDSEDMLSDCSKSLEQDESSVFIEDETELNYDADTLFQCGYTPKVVSPTVVKPVTKKSLLKPQPKPIIFVKSCFPENEHHTNGEFVKNKMLEHDAQTSLPHFVKPKIVHASSSKKPNVNYYSTKSSFNSSKSNNSKQYSPKHVERRTCFECGEYGHIIAHCPYLFQSPQMQNVKSNSIGVSNVTSNAFASTSQSNSEKQKLAKLQKKQIKKVKKLAESSDEEGPRITLNQLFKWPSQKKPNPEQLALLNLSDPDNPWNNCAKDKVDQSRYFLKKSFNSNKKWEVKSSDDNANKPKADGAGASLK